VFLQVLIAFGIGQNHPTGIYRRRTYQRRQRLFSYHSSVEQRSKIPNRLLLSYLYPIQLIPQRVHAYDHIGELSSQYTPVIVLDMLRPDNLHTIIAQMPPLADLVRVVLVVHLRGHVEQDLAAGVGIVRRSLELIVVVQTAHEALVGFQVDSPGQFAKEELVVG